jgi:Rps23 Pro-64 3,4-dihydroxylase Tpa1-like proline 4-hydroxylase|tara:strand:+ start:139 stop:684 length:546 start_codon:yes stop_codon:yes gene_type:complete
MDHTEYIVEIKNSFELKLTKNLINLIKDKCKEYFETGNGLNKTVRRVKGYSLKPNTPTNIFYFNCIKKEIERLYFFYKIKFPQMHSNKINQIDLLKYSPGGRYNLHVDHFSNVSRHLSIIINLNNNYEGGDLVFTDPKSNEVKRLKLGERSIVFFPSNFMYPHKIEPITKGTRYSIVAWLQ